MNLEEAQFYRLKFPEEKKASKKKGGKGKGTPGGPTKYRKVFDTEIVEWFRTHANPVKTLEIEHFNKKGDFAFMDYKNMPSFFPTFEAWCAEKGVWPDKISVWSKKHATFREAIRVCKAIQKQSLISGGLSGSYNSKFAQFVAINCTDMRDNSNIDITSGGEPIGRVIGLPSREIDKKKKIIKDN